MKRVLVLGGYGNAGREIVKLLLSKTEADIIVAGRNLARAQELVDSLQEARSDASRVSTARVDGSDADSLAAALQPDTRGEGVNLRVVASSTSVACDVAMAACIAARVDYLDIQFSRSKLAALESMRADIEASGICAVTDGGFHPGVPAAMIRYAAQLVPDLVAAHVGSVISIHWAPLSFSPETVAEMMEEFHGLGMSAAPKRLNRPLGRLMLWGLRGFSRPPYGTAADGGLGRVRSRHPLRPNPWNPGLTRRWLLPDCRRGSSLTWQTWACR